MRKPVRWLLPIAFVLGLAWFFWPRPESPVLPVAVKSISPDVSPVMHPAVADGGPTIEAPVATATPITAPMVGKTLELNAEHAAQWVEAFCTENDRVRETLSAVPPSGTKSDAASYLSSRIGWRGGPAGSLQLAAPLMDAMKDGSWRRFTAAQLSGLDFGWMKELLAYDHWSMQNTAAFRDARGGLLDAPEPDFAALQRWSKLRMIKARLDGDLPQATREVLHLAMLVGTSGTTLGSMIEVSLVGIVESVWKESGQVPPMPLPLDADRARAGKTMRAAPNFLMPAVPQAVRERAYECMVEPCNALVSAVLFSALARDVTALEWLRSRKGCDQALLERAANVEGIDPKTFELDDAVIPTWAKEVTEVTK